MAKMKDKVKLAFYDQRNAAKSRKIPFKFTYEQWVAWWEAKLGPNWFEMRGCRKGDYCMARRGDKGPYAAWNVECVTVHLNAIERNLRQKGENHPNSTLTNSDAAVIRNSKLPKQVLAQQFGVTRGTIWRIQFKDRNFI